MPTGTGKTEVALAIMAQTAVQHAGRRPGPRPDVPVAPPHPGRPGLRRRDHRRQRLPRPAGLGHHLRQRLHPHGAVRQPVRPDGVRRVPPPAGRGAPRRGADVGRADAAGADRHARAVRRPARRPRLADRPGGLRDADRPRPRARRWPTTRWCGFPSTSRPSEQARYDQLSRRGRAATWSSAARPIRSYTWEDLCAETGQDARGPPARCKAYFAKKAIEDRAEEKLRVLEDLFRLHAGEPCLVFAGSNAMARDVSRRFLIPCLLNHCGKKERLEMLQGLERRHAIRRWWPTRCSTKAWTCRR